MTEGWDRETREETYREYQELIAEVVDGCRRHAEAVPDCSAAPLCIGTSGLIALTDMAAANPGFSALFTVVVVRELMVANDRSADLQRRLDAQRGCTMAEITRRESDRAAADALIVRLQAEIAELKQRCDDT